MKDGYLIVVDDATRVELIPENSGNLSVEVDELQITISSGEISITGPVARLQSVATQAITEPTDSEMTMNTIETKNGKKCIECKGKRYCAKNGCTNTPCGWLCG